MPEPRPHRRGGPGREEGLGTAGGSSPGCREAWGRRARSRGSQRGLSTSTVWFSEQRPQTLPRKPSRCEILPWEILIPSWGAGAAGAVFSLTQG